MFTEQTIINLDYGALVSPFDPVEREGVRELGSRPSGRADERRTYWTYRWP